MAEVHLNRSQDNWTFHSHTASCLLVPRQAINRGGSHLPFYHYPKPCDPKSICYDRGTQISSKHTICLFHLLWPLIRYWCKSLWERTLSLTLCKEKISCMILSSLWQDRSCGDWATPALPVTQLKSVSWRASRAIFWSHKYYLTSKHYRSLPWILLVLLNLWCSDTASHIHSSSTFEPQPWRSRFRQEIQNGILFV